MKNQARAKAVKKIEKAEKERKAKAEVKKRLALWYPS
jgi:hypothetical protein